MSYIVLEKKEKIEGRCHKKSCKITVEEYNNIISGDLTDLVFETGKKLVKELAIDMLIHNYTPKVIIEYERIAYVEEITNVRITFDMKISASYELENFLDGDYQSFYVLPSGINVLEVKGVLTSVVVTIVLILLENINFGRKSFVLIVRAEEDVETDLTNLFKERKISYKFKSRNYTSKGFDYAIELTYKNIQELSQQLSKMEKIGKYSIIEYDADDIV